MSTNVNLITATAMPADLTDSKGPSPNTNHMRMIDNFNQARETIMRHKINNQISMPVPMLQEKSIEMTP